MTRYNISKAFGKKTASSPCSPPPPDEDEPAAYPLLNHSLCGWSVGTRRRPDYSSSSQVSLQVESVRHLWPLMRLKSVRALPHDEHHQRFRSWSVSGFKKFQPLIEN